MRIWRNFREMLGSLNFGGLQAKVRPVAKRAGRFSLFLSLQVLCFLLIVIGASLLCFMLYTSYSYFRDLPEPYMFEISEFHGQILPAERVRPGTFTVEVDFSQVKNWGEESLMSIKPVSLSDKSNRIYLEAWRPIQKTPGVFEHAEKNMEITSFCFGNFMYYRVKRIDFLSGNRFRAIPGINGWHMFFWVLSCIVIAVISSELGYSGWRIGRASWKFCRLPS